MARRVVKYEDIAGSSENGVNAEIVNGVHHTAVKQSNGKQPHWSEDGKPISASAARRYRRVIQLLASGEVADAEQLLTKMETAINNVDIVQALAWAKRKASVDQVSEGAEHSSSDSYDEEDEEMEAEDEEVYETSANPDPTNINIIPAQSHTLSNGKDDAWDDSALIDAWDAALEEYEYFDAQRVASQKKRSMDEGAEEGAVAAKRSRIDAVSGITTPFAPKKHSTLWYESSTVVRPDGQTEHNTELAKRKAEALSLLNQLEENQDTPPTPTPTGAKKRAIKGVRPPSSHKPGNPAWLSACAVVSKTPNEIGGETSALSSSSKDVPTQAALLNPGQPASSSTSPTQEDVLQNLAMAWYYAGYYQAMALSQMQK